MKLQLYYPVRPFQKYQSFGENNACIKIGGTQIVGKQNNVCPAGFTDFYKSYGMLGHTGTDMFGSDGTPCYYSGTEGIVEEVNTEIERGLGVGVITDALYDFEGGTYQAKTRYWHLKGINVSRGQKVKTGELLGWCDSTGFSSASHLHYELKPVLKNSAGVFYNVFQTNGYAGAVNPEPYFNGKYAEDMLPQSTETRFNKDLSYGMADVDVYALQKFLVDNWFGNFTPTGFFGFKTREAVIKFQNVYKITPALGYFGPITRGVINKLL